MVVNGENSAGGVGITEKTARELLEMGADAITLGNHAYRHREVYEFLDREERIVRPGELPEGQPGARAHRGRARRDAARRGQPVRASCSSRRCARRSPRRTRCWPSCASRADAVLVDMHAEATSEKVAMGWYLDGRVTACVGTHTHVPTADARVLPGGTAYITDVGMTGPRGGVIGVKREQAIERFLTLTQVRFETADEDPWLNAVLVEADGEGRATAHRAAAPARAALAPGPRAPAQ